MPMTKIRQFIHLCHEGADDQKATTAFQLDIEGRKIGMGWGALQKSQTV